MNVRAAIAYAGRGIARPRYHANDSSGDILDIAPIDMDIADARARKRANRRGALAFRRFAAALAGTLTSRLSSRPCCRPKARPNG